MYIMKNNKIDIYSQSELFSSNFYLFIFGKRLTIKKKMQLSPSFNYLNVNHIVFLFFWGGRMPGGEAAFLFLFPT